jgi:hypothetical protein
MEGIRHLKLLFTADLHGSLEQYNALAEAALTHSMPSPVALLINTDVDVLLVRTQIASRFSIHTTIDWRRFIP